ncbi:hypothetical protein LR48_Vigan233s002600 [Vigna angularis]|uniref:CCHC-type domain-containing protein n=1 Tax=Phaseolus angularis TaxID=3914 RepID=A0A0L9T7U5_PHAAN|nr:hypothetical protein LR48_Vigan233s002600 [Vigna angularis]
MKQQQQVMRGPKSSRNITNSRRTRRMPYARTGLPSTPNGSQAQSLVAANRSGQQGVVKCFQCGGPHYRASCPKLLGVKLCTRCRRNGHLERKCNMGGRAVMTPLDAERNQPRGVVEQAIGQD